MPTTFYGLAKATQIDAQSFSSSLPSSPVRSGCYSRISSCYLNTPSYGSSQLPITPYAHQPHGYSTEMGTADGFALTPKVAEQIAEQKAEQGPLWRVCAAADLKSCLACVLDLPLSECGPTCPSVPRLAPTNSRQRARQIGVSWRWRNDWLTDWQEVTPLRSNPLYGTFRRTV